MKLDELNKKREQYQTEGNILKEIEILREILNETEKILKDLGYTEIELTVAPENQIAIDLYKKHGYKQESFLKDEYGTGIDRFMMKKIL